MDTETEVMTVSDRVIANIVDKHSVEAIRDWGYSISEKVRYFWLVYSNTLKPEAQFGDDIPSSDGIVNAGAFVMDGGIQSLRQIIYMVNHDIPVQGMLGLRNMKNKCSYDPTTQKPYLSAVEFISFMKNKIKQHAGEVTDSVLNAMKEVYLLDHALYNKAAPDVSTKAALWEATWKDFIAGAWKKLDLVVLINQSGFLTERDKVSAKLLGKINSFRSAENNSPVLDMVPASHAPDITATM